jgi:dihydroorotase
MKTIIRNGKVIDPANHKNGYFDLVIEGNTIVGLIEPGKKVRPVKSERIVEIDATGCIVAPGFIDMHVHLRSPGFEHKETVRTGTKAAVAGGFTSVACMPNSDPVNDNETVTGYILAQAKLEGFCKVFPIGAVTKGLKGESLSEMGRLKEAGVVGFSDDGQCIGSAIVAMRAFQYASMFDMPIIIHAEDTELAGSGVMNAGDVSMELGLPGRPAVAEDIMVSRDILLSGGCGCRMHVAHISTKGALAMVRDAKKKGQKITCEVTPHHFALTEKDVGEYNTNFKMAPPLRTEADRDALIEGLADGTVDCIATDHAPHEPLMKDCEFDKAANGIIGLETALPITLELVRQKKITIRRAVELLTCGPAQVLGLSGGTLAEGAAADVTIFDPKETWTYSVDKIQSRSRNSPWVDQDLIGKVKYTLVDGKVAYKG